MVLEYHLGIVDYALIALMLLVNVGIGIKFRFFGKKQKTTKEFLLAGKAMSRFPVVLSICVTILSGVSMLGIPAESYRFGLQPVITTLSAIIGIALAAFVFTPVFFQCGVSTAYEYLEIRFGKPTRYLVSAMFVIQMVINMSAVLYAPVLALNAVTDLSIEVSIILLGSICAFYCAVGGLKAVLWTDAFQSFSMIFTMLALSSAGISAGGGVANILNTAKEGGRLSIFNFQMDFTTRYTFWNCLCFGLSFGFGTYGTSQVEVQRLLSLGKAKKAKRTLLLSLIPFSCLLFLCYVCGLILYAVYYLCDPISNKEETGLTKYDQLVPYFLISKFHSIPGLTGLCVAGIFSGSLSTISSALNSLATVTVMDFIKPLTSNRLAERKSVLIARILSIVYGIICIGFTFCLLNVSSVKQVSYLLNSILEGPSTAVFTVGVLTRKGFGKSVLLGLLAGFSITSWIGYTSLFGGYSSPSLPLSTSMCPSTSNFTEQFANISICLTFDNCTATSIPLLTSHRETFALHKISFFWVRPLGFAITLCCLFITIVTLDWKKDVISADSKCLSPVTRLWMKKTKYVECNTGVDDHTVEDPFSDGCRTNEVKNTLITAM